MSRTVLAWFLELAATFTRRVDPKWIELSALRVGLTVHHSPNPARAQRGGRSGRSFTWKYTTSVTSNEPIAISEFGAFTWSNGRWMFNTITGQPFTATDFAEWYSCPDAQIVPGQMYSDPLNWNGNNALNGGKSLWYFVGTTADGRKMKGEAIIDLLASLEN